MNGHLEKIILLIKLYYLIYLEHFQLIKKNKGWLFYLNYILDIKKT